MLLSVSIPRNSPTTSMVSTSLSRKVGCGPRFRNREPAKWSSIKQYTAIMNVVISMLETSRFLCLFRNFTNTVVSFSCQDTKTCTSGYLGRMMLDCRHPCPCGWLNDPQKACGCPSAVVTNYQKWISGPILDSIDIHTEVPRVYYKS